MGKVNVFVDIGDWVVVVVLDWSRGVEYVVEKSGMVYFLFSYELEKVVVFSF